MTRWKSAVVVLSSTYLKASFLTVPGARRLLGPSDDDLPLGVSSYDWVWAREASSHRPSSGHDRGDSDDTLHERYSYGLDESIPGFLAIRSAFRRAVGYPHETHEIAGRSTGTRSPQPP